MVCYYLNLYFVPLNKRLLYLWLEFYTHLIDHTSEILPEYFVLIIVKGSLFIFL